jgi:hypothetical protein
MHKWRFLHILEQHGVPCTVKLPSFSVKVNWWDARKMIFRWSQYSIKLLIRRWFLIKIAFTIIYSTSHLNCTEDGQWAVAYSYRAWIYHVQAQCSFLDLWDNHEYARQYLPPSSRPELHRIRPYEILSEIKERLAHGSGWNLPWST